MLSIRDVLIRVDGLSVAELRLSVRRGWVRPTVRLSSDGARQRYRFRFLEVDAARLQLIRVLRYEFGIDDETLPTVLSLMDQVYTLRADLRCLAEAIAAQPEDVRRSIAEAVQARRTR